MSLEIAQQIFQNAPFVNALGIELVSYGEGWCETRLTVVPMHLQQNGFVHAGVVATMADHTGGGAAASVAQQGYGVLSVEFKVNLLRPALGEALRCRGAVLKAGNTLTVSEAEVFAIASNSEKLVAKATITLANVPLHGNS